MESIKNDQRQTVTIQVPTANEIAAKRPFIPGSFAAIIVLFLFSFCDLKCTNGQHLASVSGLQLVTGTSIENPNSHQNNSMFGSSTPETNEAQKVPPNLWAILALVAAIAGLVVYIKRHPKEALLGAALGGAGLFCMILLRFSLLSDSDKMAQMQIVLSFKPAYWLALLAFLVAGGISFLRYRQQQNALLQDLTVEQQQT